jgi:hypothetical protein
MAKLSPEFLEKIKSLAIHASKHVPKTICHEGKTLKLAAVVPVLVRIGPEGRTRPSCEERSLAE